MRLAATLATFLLVSSALGAIGPKAGTPPPIIDEQPIGRSASSNAPAALSVIAHGIGTLDYRWWKDGLAVTNSTRISGASSNVLSISSLQFSDAGQYAVIVTNAGRSEERRVGKECR